MTTAQTQAEALRALAEPVREWSALNEAWKHPDPDCDDIALFGYVNEDGVQYPAAEVNVDTYGHEGASLQLAQFYAAATPEVVLGLLDRIAALEVQAQLAREPLAEFIERCGEVRFQRVRAGVGGPLRWDIEFTTKGGRQEVEARGSTLAQAIARAITKEKQG